MATAENTCASELTVHADDGEVGTLTIKELLYLLANAQSSEEQNDVARRLATKLVSQQGQIESL